MKAEYAPLARIVVEVSKPRILGLYVNGEPRDLPAGVTVRTGETSIWVDFTEDSMPELEGRGVGPARGIEVKWIEDE
jgi:hypothetical protein